MARRKKFRSQLGAINKIDMTPLIDLTFLLLIVFMVTMPLLEYATAVDTPDMNADPLPEKNSKSIAIAAAGNILFDGEPLSLKQLQSKLTALKALRGDTVILVRGDAGANYGRVIEVMRTIKKSGFDNPRLVTGAED